MQKYEFPHCSDAVEASWKIDTCRGEVHCETGLHIGAGKGSLEWAEPIIPLVKDAFGLP